MKITYRFLWITLTLVVVLTALIFFACETEDDDSDDEGPVGGSGNKIRYGWVVGEYNEDGATVLRTKDAGKNWVLKNNGLPKVNFNDVIALNKHTAWIVGDKDEQGEGYGTIYYTTNKGKSWQRQGDKDVLAGLSVHGVNAIDESTAWAVGDHGLILKTTNGGDSWVHQTKGEIPDTFLYKIDAVDDQIAWVLGDLDDDKWVSVLRTINGGEDWERIKFEVDKGMRLIDLTAITDKIVWVVGTEGQAHWTDSGGEEWTSWQLFGPLFHVNGICAMDEYTAVAATDQGGVYSIKKDDDSWTNISPTIEDVPGIAGFELMGITTKDGQAMWISAMNSGVPDGRIIHTADGGGTWEQQNVPVSGVNFYRLSFVGAYK